MVDSIKVRPGESYKLWVYISPNTILPPVSDASRVDVMTTASILEMTLKEGDLLIFEGPLLRIFERGIFDDSSPAPHPNPVTFQTTLPYILEGVSKTNKT